MNIPSALLVQSLAHMIALNVVHIVVSMAMHSLCYIVLHIDTSMKNKKR